MMENSLVEQRIQAAPLSTDGQNHFPFVFLYGPPGSGKSTLAPRVAAMLHLPCLDLDQHIEHAAAASIPEIFARAGEATFRRLERDALQAVLSGPPAVVALGGGTLLDPHNRREVEQVGKVVCLSAPVEVLLARLSSATQSRPLLDEGNHHDQNFRPTLVDLLGDRAEHYRSFPLQVSSALGSPAALARQLLSRLGYFYLPSLGTRRRPGYSILVQEGGLASLGGCMRQLGFQGPLALVSDANVSEIYGARVLESLHVAGYQAGLVSFPPGEAHKTAQTVAQLYQGFASLGLERGSTVVALGGGVTTDLAGFAASTYLRGIHWVAVPTSLLAMLDAAVGGKTGFDLPQGKNLAGSFYTPSFVMVDPQTLTTLPHRELLCGLAEGVKAGIVADPALFDLCAQGMQQVSSHLPEVICRALAVKVHIIQADPYERNRRAALNAGHTMGHALEAASGYKLLHGEAISIGFVLEAYLSEQLGLARPGLAAAIASCLSGLGLPTQVPAGISRRSIIEAVGVDKKRSAGEVRFSLPVRIGRVQVGVAVPGWEEWLEEWS